MTSSDSEAGTTPQSRSEAVPKPGTRSVIAIEEAEPGVLALTLGRSEPGPFVLSPKVLDELSETIEELSGDRDLRGLLFVGDDDDVFCAGADVDAMAALANREETQALLQKGQRLFQRIAHLPFPTVAMIHGTCLGGGLELALACRARTATPEAATRLGLPEVKLGIIPAWGGCTRLPRLIGLLPAIGLVTAGRSVNAARALRLGLVDSLVPREHLIREGLALAGKVRRGELPKKPIVRTDRLLESAGPGRRFIERKALPKIRAQTKGFYPAPEAALRVMVRGLGERVDESLDRERDEVLPLLEGEVHENLLRVFRLSRESARPPIYRLGKDAPAPREAVVVGAGIMGAGIATLMVAKGLSVRLVDPSPKALSRAWRNIKKELERRVRRRDLDRSEMARRLARFTTATRISGLRGVHLVLEAAPEKLELKREILRTAAAEAPLSAIIATNTSSFPLDELAAGIDRPERFCGLHFFNPPQKMPLLEIVRGAETCEATLGRSLSLAKRLGKTAVVVGDGPGFLVNRLLAPYFLEACRLAQEGLPITVIDGALRDYGLPMGPFRLMDEVGMDILLDATRHMGSREGFELTPHPLIEALVNEGHLGRKTGLGFYDHRGKKREVSANFEHILKGMVSPGVDASLGRPAIVERLVGRMVVEARRLLGDELVASPEEVDLATIYGLGFPAWRGGLLHDAERRRQTGGTAS